jgi:hypothetical protein
MHQMDVKSTILNGCLEEEVYVRQPLGYEIDKQRDKVYKLRKALYGMKKASKIWYSRIDEYLISVGFSRSQSEPTLYTKVNQEGKILIVCPYVDDLIFTGDLSIDDFKNSMKTEFEMTDLGLTKYFLGIEVDQSDDAIIICQTKYANEVLKRFRMLNCKPAAIPMAIGTKLSKYDEGCYVDPTLYNKLVGILMYLTTTRPDIMFVVSLIFRFMETPKSTHWQAGKRILIYIAGTTNFGIRYTSNLNFKLIGYTDSDFVGSIDDRNSAFGYVFSLGSGAVAWASKKQPILSLSSAKAAYVVTTTTTCQFVWMRRILNELLHEKKGATQIVCDTESAIALSNNHFFHKQGKHIDTRYHFTRELVNGKEIFVQFCRSEEQFADILQSLWVMNFLKFIEIILGSVSCNALITTILYYMFLFCFVLN